MLEVLRSGRLSLGPTIDRFEELFAERVGAPYAAAVSSGTAGLHLLCISAGIGAGRRGDHVAVLVRRERELLHLRGRRPGLRGHRPAHAQPRSGRGRGGGDASGRRRSSRVDIYGYPCELDELRAIADRHGLALIEDSCEALGAEYKGAPLGSHGAPCGLRLLSEQADDDGRGRHGDDALRGGVAAAALAAQPGPRRLGRLARARPPRLQLPPDDVARRARDRPARAARRDPARCAAAVAARYDELLARHRRASSCRAPTTPTTAARGSSTSSRLPDNDARERVIAHLRARGDRLQPLPAVDPPAAVHARALRLRARGCARSSEDVSSRSLALPFFTALERDAQERVAEVLAAAL